MGGPFPTHNILEEIYVATLRVTGYWDYLLTEHVVN